MAELMNLNVLIMCVYNNMTNMLLLMHILIQSHLIAVEFIHRNLYGKCSMLYNLIKLKLNKRVLYQAKMYNFD